MESMRGVGGGCEVLSGQTILLLIVCVFGWLVKVG